MSNKLPLSVVIITKDEEMVIRRCIDSIKDIANEILVIDSGSTDKTVEIAKEKGANVIYKEWPGYPKQVQFGIDIAKNSFVSVIDADEEVSPELRKSIINELKNPKFDCYKISRRTCYLGKFLNHVWYPEWRIRLFKKDKVKYEGFLHETVKCFGSVGKLKGDLYHYTYKDLNDHFQKSLKYAKISAENLYKEGKRFKLHKLIINPSWAFFKIYILNLGFLDGIRGLSIAMSYLFSTFLKYMFLWELEENDRKKDARS